MEPFLTEMTTWVQQGKVRYVEDVTAGLENAPNAFRGMLRGENVGKTLVQVSDDPTRTDRSAA